MNRQTLEQQRAQDAWGKASDGIEQHGKDYVNDTKGLPALIMNSGLMQTMAYLQDKGGRHHTLATHLRSWLKDRFQTPRDFAPFMQHLMRAKPQEFQAITAEALAWLKWLRHMAAAQHNKGD